jgi:glutathione S-transferase
MPLCAHSIGQGAGLAQPVRALACLGIAGTIRGCAILRLAFGRDPLLELEAMRLVIGNKNYSSWSMRPWLAAKAAGIPFEEEVIWLRQPDTKARMRALSPNAKVPALVDGAVVVFESVSILEYLAERAPSLWPDDAAARAHARSVCAEMHAGFAALRNRCPMNIKRAPAKIALGGEVEADVARIIASLTTCRTRFGSGGAFLFGQFTNADAMYAPVVNRFHAYDIPAPPVLRAYMEAMMATPMWQGWQRGALAESHVIGPIDEVS